MSQQEEGSKFPPEILVILGFGCLIGSIYLFSIQDFDDALYFLMAGMLNVVLGWWRIRVNHPEQWLINLLGFFVVSASSIIFSQSISEGKNQATAKNIICGVVESIDIREGRNQISTFTFLNRDHSERIIFSYYKYAKQLEKFEGKEMCIDYSFDPKWADYPYIHDIKPLLIK